MDIRNYKEIRSFAFSRLENCHDRHKIVSIYAAVVIGLSVLSAGINHILGLQIDQSGGLRNMQLRTVLSTLQTMLPFIQSLVVMCIELGYVSAMLRVARGQYASPNSLRLGFDRFWVMLRYTLLQSTLLVGFGFTSLYFGIMLFMLSPLSGSATELLMPLIRQTSALDPLITIPDSLYNQLMVALIPAFVICGIIFCLTGIPVLYRLRMTPYVIIDKPGIGALAAMRTSKMMMRRNCLNLLKLDLHLWWFYLASMLASLVCYGDAILPMLGITLPFSDDFSFYLFYGLYWILQFAIFYFLRNGVEVSYALAYDSIRPREQDQGGVVLGNIFQM